MITIEVQLKACDTIIIYYSCISRRVSWMITYMHVGESYGFAQLPMKQSRKKFLTEKKKLPKFGAICVSKL